MPVSLDDAEGTLRKHTGVVYRNGIVKAAIEVPSDSPRSYYELRVTYDGHTLQVEKVAEVLKETGMKHDTASNWNMVPQISKKLDELRKELQ